MELLNAFFTILDNPLSIFIIPLAGIAIGLVVGDIKKHF